ncbi:uncharacterized protein LOC125671775 isoform X4 [Ostrea edulis]|uniref:uncharacterized protein LOC125671775 isoform X4 n=1 Tax=Ostrea edulis TaxID=37623 RepID=UPI0024AF018D|nr:uncharacterized protein LOC125671775 isoform X4 [Ostrea edulis]
MLREIVALCVLASAAAAPNIRSDQITCEICHVAVHDLQKLVAENATQATVEEKLEDVCNRLTSHVDDCLGFVRSNAPNIFQTLSQKLDPESICILLDVCPKAGNHDEETTAVTGSELSHEQASPLECEICKLLITELDTLLKENKSQEIVIETVNKLCSALPDSFKKFCDAYAPQIIELIVSGVDPKKACDDIKLCAEGGNTQVEINTSTGEKETPRTQRTTEDPICEVCKLIVTEVDWYLKRNASSESINVTVNKVCNKLPSAFKILCTSMAPGIIKHLEAGFEPASSCVYLKLCTSVSDLVQLNRKIEANPLECEICKLLINELDKYLITNATTEKIEEAVTKFCDSLPAEIKAFCDEYKDKIVQALIDGVTGEEICKLIKLCTATKPEDNFIQVAVPQKEPSDETRVQDGGKYCDICEILMGIIDTQVTMNKSSQEINATIFTICHLFSRDVMIVCEVIAPVIVKEIEGGFDPQTACKDIKLCTQGFSGVIDETLAEVANKFNEEREKQKELEDAKCELCEFLVNIIDQELGRNASLDKINNTMYSLCNLLPATIKETCDLIAPSVVKELAHGLDPLKTCETLKLCTNGSVSTDLLRGFREQANKIMRIPPAASPEDAVCELCEFVVNIVDQELGQNASVDKINNTIYSLCNLLPDAVKVTCNLIAPTIVQELAKGLDPLKTCETLKLCTNGTLARDVMESPKNEHANESERPQDSAACELCEFVVQILDEYIRNNSTGESINATVYKICALLPEPFQDLCNNVAPNLVKTIEDGVDPKKACTEIKLCQNGTYAMPATSPILSCEMCHGMVEAVLPSQFTEQLALRLCEVRCPREHVRRERSAVKKLSHFESDVVQIMEGKMKPKIGNDIECDVCTWMAEATNIFLEDNKTEDSIESYLRDICKFIPEPYSKTCLTTVPLIIKELEHGFEPRKLCKELFPDDCKNVTKVHGDMPELLMSFIGEANLPSQKCDLCKQAMTVLAKELDQSDEKVLAYVEDICHRLPEPTNKACSNVIDKDYPKILQKIIQMLLDPTKVCEMVKVCP